MSYQDLFKLNGNPFRTVPATSSSELIWAGFPELKKKIETRIKRSIKIQNSTVVLNWGEYGSGKTHAARFFNKREILSELAKSVDSSSPYSILLSLPKSKYPIYEIYTSIIDKIDLNDLRIKFKHLRNEIDEYCKDITDNIHIQNVLKLVFSDTEELLVKKYLYSNITATELKELNDSGVLRKLEGEGDYSKFIAGFLSCLTLGKKIYSCVIIWIDEFEDIVLMNNTNIDNINHFLRELFDNTPNNLLLFLNLTQSALINAEDLGEYLSEALKSRIKDRINFSIPSKDEILFYLEELLNNEKFRTEEVDNRFLPFTEDSIDEIIETLGDVSLRRYNEAFSILLEISELEDNLLIDKAFFEKNKPEILPWKES